MNHTLSQKLKFSLAAFLLLLLATIGTGEVIMRLSHQPPQPPYNNKQKDKLLGWKTQPGYRFHSNNFPDIKGNQYEVHLSFDEHGFRQWGACAYDIPIGNVFVVGDSYVECVEADDAKTFYSIFKDSVPVNLFAYGCAGYGTVQECLQVEKYIDSILPDWVVLEMCSNDYVDNYWGLEMYSEYKSSQTRPYFNLNGQIEYHYPRPWFEHVKDYTLFLNFVLQRCHKALVNLKWINPKPTEEVIAADRRVAVLMTEIALTRLKKAVESKGAKLIIYILGNLSSPKNEMDDVVAIGKKLNIPMVTGAVEKIEARESNGEVMRAFDGYHFNNNGQQVMAEVLISYFRENQFQK